MTDEAIADLRDLRHQISPEFDHDPQKYIAYLQPQNYKYATQMELYQQLVQSSVPLTQPREDGVAPPRPRHPPPLPGGLADADDSVGESEIGSKGGWVGLTTIWGRAGMCGSR